MKLKDILNESPQDLVARFYKEATADFDRYYNLEDVKYKEKNAKHYDKHFDRWFEDDIVPVFTKPTESVQSKYNVIPEGTKLQSPGYRGLQNVLRSAGLPYNKNVQKYNPAATLTSSPEMDQFRKPKNN